MIVGIIDRCGTRRCAFGLAVPVTAAALRDDRTVTVYDPTERAHWRLTRNPTGITAQPPPPTLFDPDPATPAWVARLIEAVTPLL